MITKNEKSKRKYFKPLEEGSVPTLRKKLFLVRYHDEDTDSIQSAGPYSKEIEATDILKSYLKNGICCWVVAYNG
jgi:hypothetical protein